MRDRKEKDPWVIVVVLLPLIQILAPFMDLIVIGKQKKFSLIALWKEGEEKGKSRKKRKDSGNIPVYPR